MKFDMDVAYTDLNTSYIFTQTFNDSCIKVANETVGTVL